MLISMTTPCLRGLLLLSLLIICACEVGHSDTERYVHRVAAEPLVQQSSYRVNRQYVGRVEAKQRVDLGFELAGTVAEVLVDSGDQVAAGQPLVRLDTRLLDDERAQLLASHDELVAQRQFATLDIKRQQKLRTQGFTAEQRMDELKAKAQVLDAKLRRQQALLAALDTRLEKSTLRAAYAADVARRYLDKGAVVSPGQAVLQLLEKANLQAEIGVPPAQVYALVVGQMLTIRHADSEYQAKLLSIGRAINPVTRTVNLKVSLPAAAVAVDGDFLFLSLEEYRQQSGFWVPSTALLGAVRGLWNLLVLIPEGSLDRFVLERRSIEILHRDGDRAYVRGALQAGEQIVSAGLHRLVAGQMVRTMEAGH